MSIRVGINGFGRMGRLTLRAAWDNPDLQFVQINDPAGDAASLVFLLMDQRPAGKPRQSSIAERGMVPPPGRSRRWSAQGPPGKGFAQGLTPAERRLMVMRAAKAQA